MEIRQSNTVALLGGPFHAKQLLENHDPGEIDVWWLNMMYNIRDWNLFEPYITMWFEMHPFYRMRRRRQYDHMDWLTMDGVTREFTEDYKIKALTRPYPIMMRRKYKRVPNSIGYPIRTVAEQLPYADINTLFGCTHAWMMGLAVSLGYDRIECYGVNLSNPVETYLERPSWAIWYGAALYNGVDVDLTYSPYVLPTVLYGVKDRLVQIAEQYTPEIVTAQVVGIERYNDAQALMLNEADYKQLADMQHRRVAKENGTD